MFIGTFELSVLLRIYQTLLDIYLPVMMYLNMVKHIKDKRPGVLLLVIIVCTESCKIFYNEY